MSQRALLTNNLWWKLFSLALAMLIWFGAWAFIEKGIAPFASPLHPTMVREFARTRVRLLVSGAEAGRATINPPTVKVTVSGDLSTIEKLTEADLVVVVDLTSGWPTDPRTNRVDVHVPGSVKLVGVIPASVAVVPDGPPGAAGNR